VLLRRQERWNASSRVPTALLLSQENGDIEPQTILEHQAVRPVGQAALFYCAAMLRN
jgi:hypothetical protein